MAWLVVEVDWQSVDRPGIAASARMYFRTRKEPHTLGDTFSTAAATIAILSSVDWRFQVSPKILALTDGFWVWDFEVTNTVGDVYTIATGNMFCQKDVSFVDP